MRSGLQVTVEFWGTYFFAKVKPLFICMLNNVNYVKLFLSKVKLVILMS